MTENRTESGKEEEKTMWSKIKETLRTYAYIVLGVEIAVATFISIFYPDESLSVALLWQVLICCFVCVLGNLLWWTTKQLKRTETLTRIIMHYLYINVVVFGSAFLFDWIDSDSPTMLISMFLMILIIFILVFAAIRHRDKRVSELLNRRLKVYQSCGDESDSDIISQI